MSSPVSDMVIAGDTDAEHAPEDRATSETHDLQSLLAATAAALCAANEKVAARDAFIAALSRELSNPLAPVTMAVERLRSVTGSHDPERIDAALGMIERACDAFESRARSLLDVVEIAAASKTLDLQDLDAAGAMRRAAARHEDVARRAGCVLDCSAGEAAIVHVNAEALDQVLDHLLSNALKFGAGHPVHLSAASLADHVQLCVCDQGPGIGVAERGEIFGQLSRNRPQGTPGLGVGLWISHQLTGAMGGSIEVAAKAPWTTCLELVFPTSG